MLSLSLEKNILYFVWEISSGFEKRGPDNGINA
jgi:hypothetical protein